MNNLMESPNVSFLAEQGVEAIFQNVMDDFHAEKLKPRNKGTARRPSVFWGALLLTLLPVLAISLGLIVIIFMCSQNILKSEQRQALGRRLAGEDDEPPSLPELEELCTSLGHWVPDPSPGDPRRSPQLVEDVLHGIERSEEQRLTLELGIPAVAAPPRDALAGAGDEHPSRRRESPMIPEGDGDEEPGPSSKDPKRRRVSTIPTFEEVFARIRQQQASLQASAGLLPVSGEGLSTATATLLPLARQVAVPAEQVHPYARVPPLRPGVVRRQWQALFVTGRAGRLRTRQNLLRHIRALLLLPSLDLKDVEELMTAAEDLATRAVSELAYPVKTSPNKMLREAALRFLVLNAVHSAAQAVGPPMPPWWPQVTAEIVGGYHIVPLPGQRLAWSRNAGLTQRLIMTLFKYKAGDAPSPGEVIQLKREIFFGERTPPYFRLPQWDAWRGDDEGRSGSASR